ncbi:hypothetical protein [Myxococcus landrumensis]|uniref:Uncharacterized protein n=1 Tax=Myxococcus landrumensis TaxID=2813577 RepID=A0ABX7NB45_9BACT|nr:hypothetical protein [Myxococcus landrumus]QSQ14626.1 hypothetical protein JY572_00560 [Myxococcus landrumus]
MERSDVDDHRRIQDFRFGLLRTSRWRGVEGRRTPLGMFPSTHASGFNERNGSDPVFT